MLKLVKIVILSPDEIKVSNTTWAALKKSPNWASHMTKLFIFSTLNPYSKLRTASSDKILFATYKKDFTIKLYTYIYDNENEI